MRFSHITFRVKNLEESISFYEEVCGLQVDRSLEEGNARLVYMNNAKGETEVELLEIEGGNTFEGSGMFICFACDHLDEMHEKVTDMNLNPSPIQDPKDGTRYFYVYDPNKVSVQLREFN